MSIIKCKICGGDIELSDDKTIGTCMYCGSTTTLPKVDDEQRASMFNRGNHFRRIGEYDKALATYERILMEDDTDAEAHWCCALSRFGIEYVEDPNTYEWLPTCHRLSFDSFLEDVDYLAALEHSDGITKRQYQKDGAKIAEVQRGILAVSQKEDPFDVFICYKETDENNNRTVDSTLAQDIYYQLTDKGYKVFFSRITLEDKVGAEYEPYIFAALNSAKVMIVVGTKPEYLNAVWVKNEWSRFLQLIKKDRSKVIIPCYRGMDPYDLPEQLSVLQSYDMAKIGFVQDLLRGIEKIVGKDQKETKPAVSVVQQTGPNVTAFLERGYMSLEDKEWDSARKFFDEALNMNAKCAEAYLGLAMADVKAQSKKQFGDHLKMNDISDRNFDRAKQFAGDELKKEIVSWEEARRQQKEIENEAKRSSAYGSAMALKRTAVTLFNFRQAAEQFEKIIDYKDSKEQAAECREMENKLLEKRRAEEEERARLLQEKEEKRRAEEAEKKKQLEELRHKTKQLGISEVEGKMAEIKQQIQEKETYLHSLGFFKGKEKESVRNEIEQLSLKLKQEEERLEEVIQKKKGLMNEIYSLLGIKGLDGKVGDTVLFGNPVNDKNSRLEWIILAEEEGRKLLITKIDIGKRAYHDSYVPVNWETCELRRWLNTEFLNTSFSFDEKEMIQETAIITPRNPEYRTNPGNPTFDKLFLLSIQEAKKYFATDSERSIGTIWWLRSPGSDAYHTAKVTYGSIIASGIDPRTHEVAVRPALWIKV